MSDAPKDLRPATVEEVAASLSFSLRFDGRRRVHDADELLAGAVARRLVEHLERSGYVIMKGPSLQPPDIGRLTRQDKE